MELIYHIYDKAYNYNYYYRLQEKKGSVRKEDNQHYDDFRRQMFEERDGRIDDKKYSAVYGGVMEVLERRQRQSTRPRRKI